VLLDGPETALRESYHQGQAEQDRAKRRAAPPPERPQGYGTGQDAPPRNPHPRGLRLSKPFRGGTNSRQHDHDPRARAMTQERRPWRLKEMTPVAVGDRLRERATLVVPVGTTEQHGPHLPLGCDTIIVERLADDISATYGVPRAPTVEYGVHAATRPFPGGAALRRRTLHRVMNELIESWEAGAGVREFLILTAQSSEAHLEALSTIRTDEATVQVVDIFSLDFGPLLERPAPVQGGELDTSLMLYLAPDMVRMDLAKDFELTPGMLARYRPGQSRHLPAGSPGSVGFPSLASAQKGERLYTFILERVSRCLVRS
jgi:creatinine amidohydrolase